jgi:glyoxylase-like metal-dependent hydrolase (beta-lactamase superfamily II)
MSLRWQVGDVTVTSILEFEGPLPAAGLLVGATDEAVAPYDWLRGWAVDENGGVVLRVHALVVETAGRRIVVDTCVGNDKPRAIPLMDKMQTTFLADLRAAGFAPETVDTVVCTHLHVDHVGWNTMLVDGAWVPTFPNARYLMVREEVDHWRDAVDPAGDVFGDSVKPILDAGLADLVEPWHHVAPGVVLEPTPGHTPGHVSVCIRSGDDEAWISGDVMHHPVQCARPEWAAIFDDDPAAAEKTRRALLSRWADDGVLVIGTHFAAPCAGRIVREGDAYAFRV